MLLHDQTFELGILIVAELEVSHPLGDIRELLREVGVGHEVQRLLLAVEALRILEILQVPGTVGPERTPQGDHDVLFGLDRVVQLREHGRGGGLHQIEVVQTIARHDVILRSGHVTGAGLDTHDLAVEVGGVLAELLDGVDLGVLRHRQRQHSTLVVGAEVLEVVSVGVHVLGVGSGQPRRGVDVDISVGQTLVDRGGVAERLDLDVVALLLQDVLPQERGRGTVGPSVDVAEGDGAAVTVSAVVVTVAVAVVPAVAAGAQRQDGGGRESGEGGEPSVAYCHCSVPSLLWCVVYCL